MTSVRVKPWQDDDSAPLEILESIKARRPDGELIGITRILLRSFPLAPVGTRCDYILQSRPTRDRSVCLCNDDGKATTSLMPDNSLGVQTL